LSSTPEFLCCFFIFLLGVPFPLVDGANVSS
jgi:hypothetical protein